MSVTRLSNDQGAYQYKISNSVRDGLYQLDKPRVMCKQCYPYKSTPSIESDVSRNNFDLNRNLVDVNSELKGLTRSASKNPEKHYQAASIRGNIVNLTPWQDQIIPNEESRTTHPSCTLRGTGYDRWDWVCPNPQDNFQKSFKNLINNRLIVKDNHRPQIPKPLDQTSALPPQQDLPHNNESGVPRSFTLPKSVSWRINNNSY